MFNKKEIDKLKEYNDFALKFKITKDKLKMEMSLKDLVRLFENDPNNMADDGDSPAAKVKRGKRQEFAEYIVQQLMDDAPYEQDDFVWSMPFSHVFTELLESYEPEILKYQDYDNEDE